MLYLFRDKHQGIFSLKHAPGNDFSEAGTIQYLVRDKHQGIFSLKQAPGKNFSEAGTMQYFSKRQAPSNI